MYNAKGELVWHATLDIYGRITVKKGDKYDCPFRYQGQYADRETGGLYYNRFRYYDSNTGLYISQDPIGLGGGMVLYGYVGDVNGWLDVFGLMPWLPGEPKPSGWIIAENGSFEGAIGHSNFIPSDPASLGLNAGDKIPYKNGIPDFNQWAKNIKGVDPIFDVKNMNGIHGEDMPMIYKHLKEKYPKKFKSESSVKKWLSKNRVTPHHFSGDKIQLVPMQLHGNVKHTGEAYNLRNANGHSH